MPNGLQQPATLTDRGFPQEICKRIVRNVGTYRELAILSRVCREFQTEAERKIYQSIVIRDKPFALSLCKLFAACPRVAGHVRQLSIEVSSSHSRNIIPNLSFNLPELVAHALAHASRLEALWYIQPGIPLPRTPLPQVFNLVEAHLECDWDEHLMLFLEGQTRIVKLTLGDSIQSPIGIGQDGNLDQVAATGGQIEPPEGLHPGWLPNLKLLRGPWQIVMFLAQGRPLQDIKTKYPPWQLGDYDDIERFVEFMPTFLRGLGKSTARVMRLDLGDFLVDNISMVFMSEAPFYLPSLERVGRLPIPEAQYISFMEHLGKMKALRMAEFVINGDHTVLVMPRLLAHQIAYYASRALETVQYILPTECQTWRKRRMEGGDAGDYEEWLLTDVIPRRLPGAFDWPVR